MAINIYKQCKIAGKADEGMGRWGGDSTPWEWRGPGLGLALNLGVIKNEGEIISDKLMELHHALGQWASPQKE